MGLSRARRQHFHREVRQRREPTKLTLDPPVLYAGEADQGVEGAAAARNLCPEVSAVSP